MDLSEWAQRLISSVGRNGWIATAAALALTLAYDFFRVQAARREVRALGTKIQLLEVEKTNLAVEQANLQSEKANLEAEKESLATKLRLTEMEIAGETEEQARKRLTANGAVADRDFAVARGELERIDHKLAESRQEKRRLEEAEQQFKRELTVRNESLRQVRADLGTVEEQIADLEAHRARQQDEVDHARRRIANIGLQVARLGGRPKAPEKGLRR